MFAYHSILLAFQSLVVLHLLLLGGSPRQQDLLVFFGQVPDAVVYSPDSLLPGDPVLLHDTVGRLNVFGAEGYDEVLKLHHLDAWCIFHQYVPIDIDINLIYEFALADIRCTL